MAQREGTMQTVVQAPSKIAAIGVEPATRRVELPSPQTGSVLRQNIVAPFFGTICEIAAPV